VGEEEYVIMAIKFQKTWHGYLILVVLVVALILGLVQKFFEPIESEGDFPVPIGVLSEETCTVAGGTWNACGSSCRGDTAEACIMVCVEQCECEKNADCPFGYSCLEKIDGIGLCSVSS
jgi:hypothetical protein